MHLPHQPPSHPADHPVVGLVLAAGQGRRFGSDKRRALLPGGVSMIDAVLHAWTSALPQVWVVARQDDPLAEQACARHQALLLPCPDAPDGMGRALAWGARHALASAPPTLQALLVGLADMPCVSPQTLAAMATLPPLSAAAVPRHAGRLGHPRRIPRACWPALADLSGDEGARHVVDWANALTLDVPDPGVLIDIDTPEDLQRVATGYKCPPP